jgi:hypothetical protein
MPSLQDTGKLRVAGSQKHRVWEVLVGVLGTYTDGRRAVSARLGCRTLAALLLFLELPRHRSRGYVGRMLLYTMCLRECVVCAIPLSDKCRVLQLMLRVDVDD